MARPRKAPPAPSAPPAAGNGGELAGLASESASGRISGPAPAGRAEPDLLSPGGPGLPDPAGALAADLAALTATGIAWTCAAEQVSLAMLDAARGAIGGGLETRRAWRDLVSWEDAVRAQAGWMAEGFAATVEGAGAIVLAAAEAAERSARPWLGRAAARTRSTP